MVAQKLQGIVINEILVDPNISSISGYDTDGDGIFANSDEFIELYNTTDSAVSIANWTISDDSTSNNGLRYTFPADAEIGAFGKVTVVTNYNNTPLPAGFYNIGSGTAIWNNDGDRIRLSDGTNTISAGYDGTASDENFGIDIPGQSLQRTPDGGDVITSAAPTPECFLTGTRILTESGYKLVEELSIGDKVHTAEGDFVDVKWIGYQTIDPNNLAIALRGNPVLVKAGALGNNLPARDLYISPDHSLFVEGLLINAGALVNGVSIVQTEPTETFVYHSVELENHALLTVEGTYAESYMPHHEDRTNYDNGSEYEELYPHGSNLMLWPMDYPRISSKTQVPSFVSQKLSNIAQQLEGILLSA